MADTNVKNVLSVIATTGSRMKDLVIKNNQLIFIQIQETINLFK